MLDDRGPHPWRSQGRAVKVVRWPGLAGSGAVPDVASPGLEVGEVPDRGDFKPAVNAGRVHFQVEDARGREREIACGEVYNPVRQSQELEGPLGVRQQGIELVLNRLRRADADKLHLVELVEALKPPRVLPRRAGFPPEADRVSHIALRQLIRVEQLTPVHAGQGNLARGDEPQVVQGGVVGVLGELGKVARPLEDLAADHVRDENLKIGVAVEVEAELHEGADQPGSVAVEQREPGTAQLCGALGVEDPEIARDLPVRAIVGRVVLVGRGSFNSQDDVGRLVEALGRVRRGQVRQDQEKRTRFAVGLPKCRLFLGDTGLQVRQRLSLGSRAGAARGDQLSDLLGARVHLGPEHFNLGQGTALLDQGIPRGEDDIGGDALAC